MGDMKPPDAFGVSCNHLFKKPERAIKNMGDMRLWEKSEAYQELIGFIISLNEAVKGKHNYTLCHISEMSKSVISMLDKLDNMIKEFPSIEQPQRFGNAAFRSWLSGLCKSSVDLLKETLPEKYHNSIEEIKVYLEESFGNATRIDYGTGHETAFVMFLCCLYKIGALTTNDKAATVFIVFNRYLDLVRNLQQTYRMEPAGSHGVWSLDDYQFVPFIWGSAQLVAHPIIEPHKFLDEEILANHNKNFMFLSCIEYINKVKTGPFAEHSNQLWGISAVPSWSKINQGLIKMYKNEGEAFRDVTRADVAGGPWCSLPSAWPYGRGATFSLFHFEKLCIK